MKCLMLVCLLAAAGSAAPGLLDSISESMAGSSSKSHSLGGHLNFGLLKLGANLNSAQFSSHSSTSTLNSGYGASGSQAEANAKSEAHSLGGGIGFGPFSIGGSINSASSQTNSRSSDFYSLYQRLFPIDFGSSHAQASAASQTHYLGGGPDFAPFSFGVNLHSSHSQAQSSSNVSNGRHRRYISYTPFGFGGTLNGARSEAQASSSSVNNYPPRFGSGFFSQPGRLW